MTASPAAQDHSYLSKPVHPRVPVDFKAFRLFPKEPVKKMTFAVKCYIVREKCNPSNNIDKKQLAVKFFLLTGNGLMKRVRKTCFQTGLLSINCNTVAFLCKTLEHCHSVALVVVYESTVPVFQCGKKGISTVLFIGLLGTECYVIRKFLKV